MKRKKLVEHPKVQVEWNGGAVDIKKTWKMTDDGVAFFKAQEERFIKKFGRKPSGNDPVFFDPDYDVPTPYTEEKLKKILTEACLKSGVDVERALRTFGFGEDYPEVDDRALFRSISN